MNFAFMTLAILLIHGTTTQFISFCAFGNQPVCGVDYITYPNLCAIQVAAVQLKNYGPCTQMMTPSGELVMNCEKKYVPICGMDGVTYGNQCRLDTRKIPKRLMALVTLQITYSLLLPEIVIAMVNFRQYAL